MRKKLKQLIGILFSLVMVLGLMPGMSLTALAWDGDPYGSLVNNTTVVKFDEKEWYLIENNSTAANAGTVTLLSKECVAASQYNSNDSSIKYSGSTVESTVNNWYTQNITANAKTAVVDNKMFLLTKDQAGAMIEDTRKCSKYSGTDENYWWLCSRGINNNYVACVRGSRGLVDDTGFPMVYTLGVRPALKLNLSSVIFSSESKTFTVGSAKTDQTVTAPTAASNVTYTGSVKTLNSSATQVTTVQMCNIIMSLKRH